MCLCEDGRFEKTTTKTTKIVFGSRRDTERAERSDIKIKINCFAVCVYTRWHGPLHSFLISSANATSAGMQRRVTGKAVTGIVLLFLVSVKVRNVPLL